ncbi:hypothetical protein M1M07_23785 [Rhodococcus sp. HM1]|uniref:hypothetical protein n=1 Tax=Rhodococcus sp. HM1 TaxID=2937759 RepID=UPI00200A56FC|nr:hypothetical protein [Rhodococcus sp. HM1]MCK8674119.1 hypothetical protein [Rhodococcus sp. HM1]
MTDMFDAPGSASGVKWEDLNGKLLLIQPLSEEAGINTSFGAANAVRANVTVLDGPTAGEEFNDTLIFPKVLQSQVKGNVGTGRFNLGRLGKGLAKPGQSAPWMLGDPTDSDKDIARAHLAKAASAPF